MPFQLRPYQTATGVLLVLKLALLASLLAGNPHLFLYGDGNGYVQRAALLLQSGIFGMADGAGAVHPDSYRLPAYPVFLAATSFASGTAQLAVWSGIQLVIYHLWLLVIGAWIARRHGERSALYFVIALSLTLPWVHYVTTVHSDFQFAMLLFTGVVLMISAHEPETPRLSRAAFAAICLGVAALTRPDLVFLPIWLAALIGATSLWNRLTGYRVDVMPVTLSTLGTFGFMALWALRNLVSTGEFVFTSVTDTVNRYFAGNIGATPPTGGSLLESVELMLRNGARIVVDFVPALAQIFFNPSRWYLHRYFESWGIRLSSTDVPLSKIGFFALPLSEQVYMVVGAALPLALVCVFLWVLFRIWRKRTAVASWSMILMLWIMAYLVLQKGVWGALTIGSGPRYAMSIWPFVIYIGALAFTRPAPFTTPDQTVDFASSPGGRGA